MHDFPDKQLGKVVPYGVYDIAADAGCVSVGIDHDTAEFAVNAIQRWYDKMGRERYPTKPACRSDANSTPMPMPRASRSLTQKWPLSTSPVIPSTPSGTTPSHQDHPNP